MLSIFKKRESKSVLSELSKAEKKIIRAWCMYDWANSAFFTSIVSAIMPIYFVGLYRESLGSGVVVLNFQFSATVVWALTGALGTFLIALSSPIFGVIADRSGIKKKLMTIFCVSGCLATIMLFFSSYSSSPWLFSLAFYFLGAIGASGANVFYNSLLPHIAPENLLDDVSSRGYAYGYLGGGLLLFFHLIILVFFDYSDLAIRSCLASVGIWWFGWALWTLKVVSEPSYKKTRKIGVTKSISRAIRQIKSTAGEFKQFKQLLICLIAFVIFNDAIATCLGIAGAYGLDVLRISPETATLTILIVQFVAFPGSLFFSYLSKKLDIEDRIVFVGPISDYWLPAYYAATDVVVLPSTSRLEAFGIVGLEGMASGKPLILSDIPGVRDVISSEEGFIVEPLDPDAITEALERIWNGPEMAKQMGKKGRERVVKLFSWEKVSKDVEKIFYDVTSK